jgi:hypothetical protein
MHERLVYTFLDILIFLVSSPPKKFENKKNTDMEGGNFSSNQAFRQLLGNPDLARVLQTSPILNVRDRIFLVESLPTSAGFNRTILQYKFDM